jgi:hypothetical protein
MILRTYMCPDCGHSIEVELTAEEWNSEPPDCSECAAQYRQEFKPPAIGGSPVARATEIARKVYEENTGNTDFKIGRERVIPSAPTRAEAERGRRMLQSMIPPGPSQIVERAPPHFEAVSQWSHLLNRRNVAKNSIRLIP